MPRRASRSPLVLDARPLGRRPGSQRDVHTVVPAPTDLALDVIEVPGGSDLHLRLRLAAVVEGVLVTGEVEGTARGTCVRCLDPVAAPLTVELQELFAYPDAPSAADDDLEQVDDDHVDVERTLRDAVVLALPLRPLCRADCPGLCATCGARLASDPTHRHDDPDPRWASLSGLHQAQPASVRRPDEKG